jgi:hypothetical protein
MEIDFNIEVLTADESAPMLPSCRRAGSTSPTVT